MASESRPNEDPWIPALVEPLNTLPVTDEIIQSTGPEGIVTPDRPSTPVPGLPSSPLQSQAAPPSTPLSTPNNASKLHVPRTSHSRSGLQQGSKSPKQWKSPQSKLSRFSESRSRVARHSLTSSPYNWSFPTPNLTSCRFRTQSRTVSSTPFAHVTSVDTDAAAAAVPVQYSSTGDIVGITPARLIIHMTSPELLDYNLLSDFFISYRQFMTDNEVLRLLTARYKWAVNRSDDIGRVIRLRIFVALRHWILNYFADDFVPSLGLRRAFTNAINEFCRYGKVRSSSGDRRLLGELKRCWIRVCSLYWDMPAGVYSSNVLMLGPDRCFDERLHPGGEIGSRGVVVKGGNQMRISQSDIWQTHISPKSSLVGQLQSTTSQERSSSPILPRNELHMPPRQQVTEQKQLSSSASSISNESALSLDEPRTPPPTVPNEWLWGCLIRGKAKTIVGIPTDDQSMVDAIIPPSPTPDTQSHGRRVTSTEESDMSRESSVVGRRFSTNDPKVVLKSWRRRVFGNHRRMVHEPIPQVAPDFAVTTPIMSSAQVEVHRGEQLQHIGVRIDILAASVVDNYKQLMDTGDDSVALERDASQECSSLRSLEPQRGLGLGLRRGHWSALHDSPSRTIRTTHNDTDIKSLRGTVIDFDDEGSEGGKSDSTGQELTGPEFSFLKNRTRVRQLPMAHLTYGSVSGEVDADHRTTVSNPNLLHFPEFSPSHSSTSDSSGCAIQVADNFPGLRRRAAASNLKTGIEISPTKFRWTSSSSLGASFDSKNVTRYSPTTNMHPLQRVRASSPLDVPDSSANMLLPGISENIAKEIVKLAEIPDDPHEGENAVDIALQKLEGTFRSSRLPVAEEEDSSHDNDSLSIVGESRRDEDGASFTPRRARGNERNAWFVDGRALDYSVEGVRDDAWHGSSLQPPSSPPVRSYHTASPSRDLSLHSERLSRDSVVSVASGASSTVSLSIHLPFILKYRAIDLAEQFTIIDRDALAEVDWKELIELRWKQDVAPVQDWLSLVTVKDVRGVELIISRFNLMTSWVTSEILLTRGLEERVRTIVKFIHVAAHTRELQNYSTFMQLTLALASATVQRLRTTWEHIPPEDVALFQSLEELASPLRNFHNLRRAMEKSDVSKGCVPFIGLYLSDLTFNAERPMHLNPKSSRDSLYSSDEDSNNEDDICPKSRRKNGASNILQLINVQRFRTSASIMKKLLYFVNSAGAYNDRLKTNPEVVSRCLYISCLDDDEIEECFQLMESP
ncbi:ras guanine nucleotide exchange factor domain-containing protein [Lipomyces kononenkoae]|uniref:Ras guanine nucleotide exchange factor domain-containing protein n=1 Tax=Lipomyces kononenkoae TaxID=34357 RepID=A0ACC3T196_LIPKO